MELLGPALVISLLQVQVNLGKWIEVQHPILHLPSVSQATLLMPAGACKLLQILCCFCLP